MTRPGAAHFNAFFRDHVFGNHDIFSARSYADFIRRNEIDLDNAVTAFDGDTMIGALAFALRGDRAWFGLIGVRPAHRRDGVGKRMFVEAIERVRERGARSIELEVSQKNAPTLHMCESLGFEPAGELLVWARKALSSRATPPRRRSGQAPARIEGEPPACWQREPRSVARAKNAARIEVRSAYAIVRVDGDFANLLDAGAADAGSARALLDELDARVAHDLTLNNEPSGSALTAALRESTWRVVERQQRFVLSLDSGASRLRSG